MMKLVNNYTYRYHNPKKVYCITDNNVISMQQKTYFTIPYISKRQQGQQIDQNVLLAYSDMDMCIQQVNYLMATTKNENIISVQTELTDLRYISKQMGVPVVVVLGIDKNTGLYDIYLDYLRYDDTKMQNYD